MNNQEKNTYVRIHILNSLLDMLKTQDISEISVSELVSKAEVGRASFYRNYQTKEDVLREEAERLNNELKCICKDDDSSDIRLRLMRTLDFYKLHTDFYLTLYNAGLKQIIQDSIVDETIISSDLSAPIAYTLSAFSYLIYGWIIEWIRRGMCESSEELVALFEQNQGK